MGTVLFPQLLLTTHTAFYCVEAVAIVEHRRINTDCLALGNGEIISSSIGGLFVEYPTSIGGLFVEYPMGEVKLEAHDPCNRSGPDI